GFEALRGVWVAANLIVVRVESLCEPEPSIEHECADERRSVIPGILQQPGHGGMRLAERVDAVLTDAMLGRKQTCENRRVRGEREWHRRPRRPELHCVCRKP